MAKRDEAGQAGRQRRDFLKVGGVGMAMALLAARESSGSNAVAGSGMRRGARRAESVDRGIWVTWYDVPEESRESYLAWLHATYLPQLLKRPGYLWAAHYASGELEGGATNATRFHHVDDPKVGAGYQYILLIGATDAGVFGNPVPSAIHASLSEQDRKMLALRTGERVNLFTETSRRKGLGGDAYKEGAVGAPFMQMGSFICPPEFEEEMLGAYVQLRMPAICEYPSSIMIRKFNSAAGWAKHMIFYEYSSREGYERDYDPAVKKSPLGLAGKSIVPNFTHAPNGPNLAVRIWPPVLKNKT